MENDRAILLEFIRLYGSLPELWDTSRKDYTNRKIKLTAYNKLLTVFRKYKRSATLDDVKKKINSLRSNYSKELRKISASKRIHGEDNVYKPTSWVFHELNYFLKNIEKSPRVMSSVICKNPKQERDSKCLPNETRRESDLLMPLMSLHNNIGIPEETQLKQEERYHDIVTDFNEELRNQEPIIILQDEDKSINLKRKRESSLVREERKFIKACTDALKTVTHSQDSSKNEKVEAFMTYFSNKFKEISDNAQMLYAESLISQVIYSAIMNKLSPDTTLINQK